MSGEDSRKQFDLSAKISKVIVGNSLVFDDTRVVFLGDDPFTVDDLVSLLPDGCHTTTDTIDLLANFVVIGTRGFDESQLIDLARAVGPNCAFLPQDGFLDLVLFGYNWWTDFHNLMEDVALHHPAFKILKALDGFTWPSTYSPESAGDRTVPEEFRPETELKSLGYQITGSTRARRWNVLEIAVPMLGLRVVVETIANHVRLRKAQKGGRFKFRNAIAEWTHDLDRLKRTYYVGPAAQFRWPSIEP